MTNNPVSYFEIPVSNMDRAIRFYEAVFSNTFERTRIDGVDLALFPADADMPGASGALALGESYVPSSSGPRIYFTVSSIDPMLDRITEAGGRVAYPKTSIGELGWVAEFEDSEGNQIALHASRD